MSAAGYFFKVKQDAPKDLLMPVLIGKSVVLLKEPGAGNNPTALDKTLRVFKYIRDKAPIAKSAENWEEAAAWNRILLHAHRFTPEELEARTPEPIEFAPICSGMSVATTSSSSSSSRAGSSRSRRSSRARSCGTPVSRRHTKDGSFRRTNHGVTRSALCSPTRRRGLSRSAG